MYPLQVDQIRAVILTVGRLQGLTVFFVSSEPPAKCSVLTKVKEGEDINPRNTVGNRSGG